MPEPDKEKEEAETLEEKLDLLVSEVRDIKSSLEDLSKREINLQVKIIQITSLFGVGFGFMMAAIAFFANWWFSISSDRMIFFEYFLISAAVGVFALYKANRYTREHFKVD